MTPNELDRLLERLDKFDPHSDAARAIRSLRPDAERWRRVRDERIEIDTNILSDDGEWEWSVRPLFGNPVDGKDLDAITDALPRRKP